MKTNKLLSILMMLVIALSASISFSSCGSDDDDTPSGGGSTTGGGASAASVPGSYTGVTNDDIETLTAVFVEDGTGIINENGHQYSFTYSMGEDTGIAKVKESYYETYTYTIKFIEGFLLFEQSNGSVRFFFYKTGQNLGSPKAKKLIGNWEGNRVNRSGKRFKYSCTFNSDGTGTLVSDVTDTDGDQYEDKETFTYKMENSYVASYTKHDDDEDDHNHAIIVLNNKAYFYGEVADIILSKK